MTKRKSKRDTTDALSSEDEEYEDGDNTKNVVRKNYSLYARTAVDFARGADTDSDDDFDSKPRTPAKSTRGNRGSILRDSTYSRPTPNTVTWTDYNTDDDENLDDSKGFGFQPSVTTFATGGSSLDSEMLAKNLEKMETRMKALQKEVGKVSRAATTDLRRKSNMIRTSLILRDVDFSSSEELQSSSQSHYPLDCYSLIALNGPCGGKWSLKKMKFFFFGFMVFSFQISFLVMMLLSRMNQNASDIEIDNPIPYFLQFIPSNSKEVIRVSQIITLLTYTLFPDASLMDVFRSYQYWPKFSKATKDDPVYCMVLSCLLRGFQGYLATMAVFLVVITTPSVVDIILNFTALSFISSLDDEAFALIKAGVFGSALRDEVERIEEEKLPACFTPQKTLQLYWRVMGSTGTILFSLLFCVIGFQNSPSWWVTPNLRVEFMKGTGLDQYSGCYSINRDLKFTSRFAYTNADFAKEGESINGFAYCTDNRRWNFFKDFDDNLDPCAAESQELARSIETDFFDIAKLFEELWFYPLSTTPVDLFFFQEDNVEALNCGMFLGNGVCDEPFNIPGYNYDEGDCCVATCNHPDCGYEGYQDGLFGTNISGNGYPSCKNPDMQPITIHFNDIVSSRDSQFEVDENSACMLDLAKGEDEWRAVTPENPVLFFRCKSDYILTLNVDESMKNSKETVWLEDGTDCVFGIFNTTSVSPGGKDTDSYAFYCDDPVWFVNYTITHETAGNQVEILTQHSSDVFVVPFRTIPQCYFDKLGYFVDVTSIYSTSNPSHQVISSLLDGVVPCSSNAFTERFALSTMIFEMNGNIALLDKDLSQCRWSSWIKSCTNVGETERIDLQNSSLEGQIPKEVVLLTSLKELNLHNNQVTAIPSEIGELTALEKLWLHNNMVKSIPSEIGFMEKLETLWLNNNQISYVPNEIGFLTNLKDLDLGTNAITSIPSDIGLLTSLEALWLGENRLTSIPTEIGVVKDLEYFWSFDNRITSLPTEFGLLSKLEAINLNRNNITFIPSEIGLISDLRDLQLGDNQITSIPTEIGLLNDLRSLRLNNNQISSIPSEIAKLNNLNELHLDDNTITSLPSEIGSMTNLEKLVLKNNDLRVNAIPREIRMLCLPGGKTDCDIEDNPSEIGMLGPIV